MTNAAPPSPHHLRHNAFLARRGEAETVAAAHTSPLAIAWRWLQIRLPATRGPDSHSPAAGIPTQRLSRAGSDEAGGEAGGTVLLAAGGCGWLRVAAGGSWLVA